MLPSVGAVVLLSLLPQLLLNLPEKILVLYLLRLRVDRFKINFQHFSQDSSPPEDNPRD